ncbi:type II toxin-antitoxin system RelE/ParE family toxin [Flavobacterium sp.]|jgi:phage-related protein|uniref:type II toxin-antitoxin system RelE/ParE family toxin n=1 Tax=Flavobacterium sp. TaxID=239 RepID=UPI0037C0BF3D
MDKFKVIFLTEAREFLLELDEKSRDKIIFNIDKSKIKNDNELFKKLKGEIWEFRTLYNKTYFRIFAFWDKTEKVNSSDSEQAMQTLVLATHGIIKKTGKTPEKEIEKAENIRLRYFELKNIRNEK